MKKTLLTLCMALMAMLASAQQIPQGLGIQIGFAEPILRLNDPNPNFNKDSLANKTKLDGIKIGLVYDATYIKGFGLSLGINYTLAGKKTQWIKQNGAQQQADYPKNRTSILYNEVEIFADWQYKFEIAKETYLMLYTGPTIQCGIGLKSDTYRKDDVDQKGDLFSSWQHYNNDVPDREKYNRLNVTWGLGAGFQYKRYFLRGGYDFGLMNPYKVSNFDAMNNLDGVSMGYQTRYTRGRLDQWSIKAGIYLWYK